MSSSRRRWASAASPRESRAPIAWRSCARFCASRSASALSRFCGLQADSLASSRRSDASFCSVCLPSAPVSASRSPAICASVSLRIGVTHSAAADGVGARRSAARSHSVTSVSWPTAETTGFLHAATARTTHSSLKVHRSSIEPPPRATMITLTLSIFSSRRIACTTSSAAPMPCTLTGHSKIRACGSRRSDTFMMS